MWNKILTGRVTKWAYASPYARAIKDTEQGVEGMLFALTQPTRPSVNKQNNSRVVVLIHPFSNKTMFFAQKGSTFLNDGGRDGLQCWFEHPTKELRDDSNHPVGMHPFGAEQIGRETLRHAYI